MKKFNIYIVFILALIFVTGCSYEFPKVEKETPTQGNADFTKFISIGNSLTAGYMDGALYNDGQAHSFPSIIAQQMQLAGGGEFNQPDIDSENGFYAVGPNNVVFGRLVFNFTEKDAATPSVEPTIGDLISSSIAGDKSKINNFGVPSIVLGQALIPGTGTLGDPAYNPYYARFASDPGSSTILGDAVATQPTFFSLWLGNNDVLGYATTGGDGSIPLTDPNDFAIRLGVILNELTTKTSAKGVVANIPDVVDIPFFTTINGSLTSAGAQPFMLDAMSAAGLNAIYMGNGYIFDDELFVEGENYFAIVIDPNTKKVRQMNPEEDLLVLKMPTDSLSLGLGTADIENMVALPIGDQHVLDKDEVAAVQTHIQLFNTTIANAVTANDKVELVDMYTIFKNFKSNGSIVEDGVALTPDFGSTGAFSLDGVHPNPRGSAFIANEFMKVINGKFGSTLPLVRFNDYRGNSFNNTFE